MKKSAHVAPSPEVAEWRRRAAKFLLAFFVILVAGSPLLIAWARFGAGDGLASYILIVPMISLFLGWQDRSLLDKRRAPAPGIALLLGGLALVLLVLSLLAHRAYPLPEDGALSLGILSLVAASNALAVGILGKRFMAGLAFPAAFLVFMAPLPPALVELVEHGLQHASAEVSAWFFSLAGVPFFRTGLSFQLPTITIAVAPECSGIRSTLVLFITSLVAGHLVLEKTWQKVVLAALVIPLGIARNAARIVTIGWLCTEQGPQMIDSPIHHRGGPWFFIISLIPLFILLLVFRRMGRPRRVGEAQTAATNIP